ncbi:hypothetical protein G5B47_02070 [Paenibacillus sp. 7124]|uniref:Uncharacterized protein n=2 Tax=Paenibacillus TaxID=44249 RepID=A0A6M1PGV5_9BACL|nr:MULTISPECIES: hypothetical protein [Paenibacillus]AHV98983.1 hypothetical protein PSAB_20460 [Paenibacillus sabinae T27]NGM81193.1 hypothetical protein [Paenibacillus apii]
MAQNIEKIELGPAIVEFGTGVDMVTFETTIGGVVLTTETAYREQRTDQTGETVVGKRVTGRNVSVTIPFGEYDLPTIPKIMVGAEAVTDGTDTKIIVKTGVGLNLLDSAKKAIIKPIAHKTDANYWVTLPLAYPETDLSYSYNNENERITNVTLRSTPDADDIVAILGDETVTATP